MLKSSFANSMKAVRSWSGPDLTHLAFEVDDIEEFAETRGAKGYPLSDGPHPNGRGGAIAFIDAPEGYEIELIQRGRDR